MSAETLREAAKGIRDEWAEGLPHIKPVAFYRAVADWLDATASLVDADVPALEQTALAVARAYLGERR